MPEDTVGNGGLGEAGRGERRPDWCLLGKVNENGETVLFREKFTDWPDTRGLIGLRTGGPGSGVFAPSAGRPLSQCLTSDWQLAPCNPHEMLATWKRQEPACLELEGCRLGRGGFWTEVTDGLRRSFQLETLSVRAWLVTADLERRELPAESVGQLHSGSICLLRWQYRVIAHGGRLANVGGGSGGGGASAASAAATTGRDRCAYFYWQGAAAGQKEKGAGALLTVQLDEERCPQLHVAEGDEPPAFLRIFQGSAMIYSGSREDAPMQRRRPLLLLVRGHDLDECALSEVPCCPDSLRPRGCFILLVPGVGGDAGGARGFVWQGACTAAWYRDLARKRAAAFESATPVDLGLTRRGIPSEAWTAERQGTESADFWAALGRRASEAESEAEVSEPSHVRIFKFSSATRSGELQFALVPDIGHSPERPSPFACQQATFKALPQPANAFVLLDCGSRLYVWQGWNPAESDASLHGSSLTRFEAEKRAVLSTAIEYGKLVGIPPDRQQLVFSGYEPAHFCQLFPHWSAAAANQHEPAATSASQWAPRILTSVHNQLSNLTFSLAELQRRPLPEGADPSRLEVYLVDSEFAAAFGMPREEFAGLNDWRRLEIKKALGLY